MTAQTMNFTSGSSKDGPYEFGYETGWHWSKNGGKYDNNRDFFWIHWEINDKNPDSVKLHVECPKAALEPELNKIKGEIVEALLSAEIKKLVEGNGYTYIVGRYISTQSIQKNKGTQVFRILLPEDQRQATHQANIKMINAIMSDAINAVIEPFMAQLDKHFAS